MEKREKIIKILSLITETSVLAIVFSVPLYFSYFRTNFHFFELNKLLLFHLFLFIALAAYWAKALFAGSFKLRISPKIIWLTLLLALSYYLSSLLSLHPSSGLWGSYIRQQGFYSLASYLLFFLLLLFQLENWQQIRRIIIAILSSSLVVALYGLAQQLNYDPIGWTESAKYMGRIFSSLGQPNYLGQYLIMILPLSIFAVFFLANKWWLRALLILIVILEFGALYFSFSRAAWLGIIAAGVVWLLFYCYYRQHRKIFFSLIVFGLLAVAVVIFLNRQPSATNYYAQFGPLSRLESALYLRGVSANQMRFLTWGAGISELRSVTAFRLFFGYGPDALTDVYVKYYQPEWGVYEKINTFPDRSHNFILDSLLQFGLIGAAALSLFYVYIIIFSIKKIKLRLLQMPAQNIWLTSASLAGLTAYFASNLFSFPMTVSRIYLSLLLALLIYSASEQMEPREFRFSRLKEDSRIFIAVISVLLLVFFFYQEDVSAYLADRYLMSAAKSELYNNPKTLMVNTSLMIGANPGRIYYIDQYVLYSAKLLSVIKPAGRPDLAQKIISQLEQISPEEMDYYVKYDLGQAYLQLGLYYEPQYFIQAEKIYQELVELSPFMPANYLELGRVYLAQKKYDLAFEILSKGLAVMPSIEQPELNSEHRQAIKATWFSLFDNLQVAYTEGKDNNKKQAYQEWVKSAEKMNK
jgi:O-antigen ligase